MTGKDPTRLLFAVQNFRQGWGGAPESVRLAAVQLQTAGIICDVLDRGRLVQEVGGLEVLPEAGASHPAFDAETLPRYRALAITGPWQSPATLMALVGRLSDAQRLLYLPRGGLGRAEFARLRDLKKLPYFAAIERRFVSAADVVVYSSETERANTPLWARPAKAEAIIPDFVSPPARQPSRRASRDRVSFAFLAEISPRKGLHVLVDAFRSWVQAEKLQDHVRLVVGGATRPGSERYLAAIKQSCRDLPIEFVGSVPHLSRPEFYSAGDVLVVSSLFESFGLTVLEALGEGCVVVACPNVGSLEFIPTEAPLIKARASTPEALAEALDSAYQRIREPGGFAGSDRDVHTIADSINRRALQAWADLLQQESSGTRRTNGARH